MPWSSCLWINMNLKMFCDKKNVNILTAILPQIGITDVVVCPGSRNGVIVHNFNELSNASSHRDAFSDFRIHAVTDERSAAFVALGISLAENLKPVAVCVTSGSALLNTLPAVAEAFYQHVPLLVISADRPKRLIGQLDGQTIVQNSALMPYAKTYELPEPQNDTEEHWCRNLVSEACIELKKQGRKPVHINVPITEPLFTFTTEFLPLVKPIAFQEIFGEGIPGNLVEIINKANLPTLVIGQYDHKVNILQELDNNNKLLILPEIVSNQEKCYRTTALECSDELRSRLQPDVVIHVGDNMVNKQLKLAFRKRSNLSVIRIQKNAGLPDTFEHIDDLVLGDWERILMALSPYLHQNSKVQEMRCLLDNYNMIGKNRTNFIKEDKIVPTQVKGEKQASESADVQYTTMLAIKKYLQESHIPINAIHLANSSVVRTATKVFCDGKFVLRVNRGVNGIEGSLSVAVGNALVCEQYVLVFIGDLSFFYDQNALWNSELLGNLRIVLFNNSGGGIFKRLPGLDASPACGTYISGAHQTSAKGIAEAYRMKYLCIYKTDKLEEVIANYFGKQEERSVLLEIYC